MKVLKVEFLGAILTVFEYNGKPYVPAKPICENIGIDWEGQRQRIQRDDVLAEGAFIIQVPSNGGNQEMVCLPLHYLNGWLFGINTKKVRPAIRDKMLRYKKECYEALWQYWETGIANREDIKKKLAELAEFEQQSKQQGTQGSLLMHKRKKEKKEIELKKMNLVQRDLFESLEI